MATKKKTAKKQYFPKDAVARTYYFSENAMKAFDEKFEELGKAAINAGVRTPKRHELASRLFCLAGSIDVKAWFK